MRRAAETATVMGARCRRHSDVVIGAQLAVSGAARRTLGDGFLAMFDGPSERSLAMAICDAVKVFSSTGPQTIVTFAGTAEIYVCL